MTLNNLMSQIGNLMMKTDNNNTKVEIKIKDEDDSRKILHSSHYIRVNYHKHINVKDISNYD